VSEPWNEWHGTDYGATCASCHVTITDGNYCWLPAGRAPDGLRIEELHCRVCAMKRARSAPSGGAT
jgi:ferredoxin